MKKALSCLLCLVILLGMVPLTAFGAEEAETADHLKTGDYSGKIISIMGDSISTFSGYIPARNAVWYPKHDVTSVDETWWMQLITQLDAKLGINESWSASHVLNTIDGNSGDMGEDAAMASNTRILNLGSNGTPDVILFFGGTNDIAVSAPLTGFDPTSAPTEADLLSTKWSSYTDAYVAAIMRMQYYYPDAQIVVILPTINLQAYDDAKLERYNSVMRSICDHYGVAYVDLVAAGYTADMLGDVTHPNMLGMDFITAVVMERLLDSHTHCYDTTTTAPTCTEQGYTTYTCECGDSYADTYIDALGHINEDKNNICDRCGELLYPDFVMGDMDGDGQTDVRDVIVILQAIAGKNITNFTERQFIAANVNHDSRVNARDAIIILNAIASKTTDQL